MFPFLAPFVFKYICTTLTEEAVDDVDLSDLPLAFAEMLHKVKFI